MWVDVVVVSVVEVMLTTTTAYTMLISKYSCL